MMTVLTEVKKVKFDELRHDILKELVTTLVLSNCEPDTMRKRLNTDIPAETNPRNKRCEHSLRRDMTDLLKFRLSGLDYKVGNTHITVSRVEYESCICRFTPPRHRRRKSGYGTMTASVTPYHHIGWIEKGCTEVLAAACN